MFLEPRFLHVIVPEGATEKIRSVLDKVLEKAIRKAEVESNHSVVVTPENNLLVMVNPGNMNWGEMGRLRQTVEECLSAIEKKMKKSYETIWLD